MADIRTAGHTSLIGQNSRQRFSHWLSYEIVCHVTWLKLRRCRLLSLHRLLVCPPRGNITSLFSTRCVSFSVASCMSSRLLEVCIVMFHVCCHCILIAMSLNCYTQQYTMKTKQQLFRYLLRSQGSHWDVTVTCILKVVVFCVASLVLFQCISVSLEKKH